MNTKVAINSQLSMIESKKQTEQTNRTGTESQIWRSCGGLSAGRVKGKTKGKGAGIKKYKLVVTEQAGGCQDQVQEIEKSKNLYA